MKLAFTGKGGVGKTTVASLLIRSLEKDKRRVLAVDCDPDANLAGALGFPNASEIIPVSKMKDLIHERMEIKNGTPIFYKMNPRIDDIPEKFLNKMGSIELIAMGTVEKGGKGCVCPESVFLKSLLGQIVLGEGEDVVMDMDPGIEHIGRQTAKSVDYFVVIVEPSAKSATTAQKIKKLSADIGIKDVFIIGNKIRDDKDKAFIQSSFGRDAILGMIPMSERILYMYKKAGGELEDKQVLNEIEQIKNKIFTEEKEHAGK